MNILASVGKKRFSRKFDFQSNSKTMANHASSKSQPTQTDASKKESQKISLEEIQTLAREWKENRIIQEKVLFKEDKLDFPTFSLKPSSIFQKKSVHNSQILGVYLEGSMPEIHITPSIKVTIKKKYDTLNSSVPVTREILFLSYQNYEALKQYVLKKNIPLIDNSYDAWTVLLEPFLDVKDSTTNFQRLEELGISKEEAMSLQNDVRDAMISYNIESGLWE